MYRCGELFLFSVCVGVCTPLSPLALTHAQTQTHTYMYTHNHTHAHNFMGRSCFPLQSSQYCGYSPFQNSKPHRIHEVNMNCLHCVCISVCVCVCVCVGVCVCEMAVCVSARVDVFSYVGHVGSLSDSLEQC